MGDCNIYSVLAGMFGIKLYDYLTFRYNYDNLFAKTISKSRMQWIDNFRDELGTFIGYGRAICGMNVVSGDCAKYGDVLKLRAEAEKARCKLITRLNRDISKHGNEWNLALEHVLENIELSRTDSLSTEKIQILLDLARKILENEWQKVKREAKGKEK